MLFWAAIACYSPYIVVFLSGRGVSSTSIGIILTLNSIVTVLSQPLWGMISDRMHSIKKVFSLCIIAASVLILFLPLIKSMGVLMILLPLIALMQSPLVALLDTWTLKSAQNGASSYGAIRLWGSIGYAIAVVIMGVIVGKMSINLAFISYGAINCAAVFVCLGLKDIDRLRGDDGGAPETSKPNVSVGNLLKNSRYMIILLFMCLLYVIANPMNSFLPKLMLAAGGTTGLYGLALAIAASVEVPALFYSDVLMKKIKPLYLILIAVFFYMVRMIIYSTFVSPLAILLSQLLQAFSFALVLPGIIHYIDSLAAESLKSTAQTTAAAVYSGLGGSIGNYVGGHLADRVGIVAAYRSGAIYVAVVFVLFACYVLSDKVILSRQRR